MHGSLARTITISIFLAVPAIASATETSPLEQRLEEVFQLMQTQQEELESQRKLLTAQGESIERLQAAIDDMRAPTDVSATSVEVEPETPELIARPEQPTPPESESEQQEPDEPDSPEEVAEVAKEAQQDDPTRAILESLPGAMRLPGTSAVMRWGGYVKSAFVQNFDPLAITDRFIVGAIPVGDIPGTQKEANINVSQSRMSLDLRDPTKIGLVRAFIEGDFDGDDETFRLRHAFGQSGSLLMGKTWSVFVDTTASPEEIDFEGLNGRINVRQGQFRWQPGIGRKYELVVSLEDPNPQVTGGEGVSQVPDIVSSARVNFTESIHARIAVLLRQVRAQWDEDLESTEEELGWGVSIGGHIDTPWLNPRDKILVQLNAGTGFGRYVNDLGTVGDFDGVFSPEGKLELIDVLAGYVSAQHWWRGNMRSNFTVGYVELDNPNFVDDSFYKRTFRVSANLIWSPTERIDVGTELLWGRRENEGGADGDATQFQFATKFRF